MNEGTPKPSILLIDDREDLLEKLRAEVSALLRDEQVDVRSWLPQASDDSPFERFNTLIDDRTVLVVTDYDLTSKGLKGLFGPSIVEWSQLRAIPVGDFSRGNRDKLPKEPNLFELRIPTTEEAAPFICATYHGFKAISDHLVSQPKALEKRSLAGVLAALLERPHLESQFGLYMSRLGSANSVLVAKLISGPDETVAGGGKPQLLQLLAYVLGHILLNSVLRFPGPILSGRALAAYVATSVDELDALRGIFAEAGYNGPFGESASYYWRETVDVVLDRAGERFAGEELETGDFNRKAVEAVLGRKLNAHTCPRCRGQKGGFLCPFTDRPVCQRADCSVPASSWIPQGAQLCRVERDFYDEWAPLLGL